MSLSTFPLSGMAILLATTGLTTTGFTAIGSPTAGELPALTTGTPYAQTIIFRHRDPRPFFGHRHWPQPPATVQRQSSSQSNSQSSSQSSQQSSHVYSGTSRLNQPHVLTVSTTARSLNATLKINGQTIKTLVNASEVINLSEHLTSGLQTLEITGTYSPASASTQISLTGPGTQISQQVSGSGKLQQTLQISAP